MVEIHTCTRSNKGGNKHVTQGWIANVVTDKLKSNEDVSPYELRKWIMQTYNIDVPYLKVFRGKEQAYTDMYGFVVGCHPYIGLDSCHLKGKFNGVIAAATGIDENTRSWTWFLDSLKKAIGTPNALVISSNMQKGLEVAMMNVYPNVEHRECIRHLYRNFKKHFHGDFFNTKLWAAAKTYRPTNHDRLLKEISDTNEDAIEHLNTNHKTIWSIIKFGITSKCNYITNNILETFNSWIGKLRYKPMLDLLDVIREKIMKRFDKKRNLVNTWNDTLIPIAKNHLNDIAKNFGEYEVTRSCDNQAEMGTREHVGRSTYMKENVVVKCENFKAAYAFQIDPMPGQDQWA
ncbi:uncharacterized protein LOC122197114 [Lactuca sativa]|uniref:uncharacterized protein LOC122197114 n=1 Tax=Lactuca sativa TaxID=4236 RepID=UPI001C691BE2|nr:uncharacterized protein LOC122197114 [Lactuca sativa]